MDKELPTNTEYDSRYIPDGTYNDKRIPYMK